MRLYLVQGINTSGEGPDVIRKWVTNQAECAAARKQMQTIYGVKRADFRTDEYEVDTKKLPLCALLNELVTSSATPGTITLATVASVSS